MNAARHQVQPCLATLHGTPCGPHLVAAEVTVVVSGRVSMNGREFTAGDVVLKEPGEIGELRVAEDSLLVIVKEPCVAGDKYPAAEAGQTAPFLAAAAAKEPEA